jgi:hypothetical protein
MSTVGYFTNYP